MTAPIIKRLSFDGIKSLSILAGLLLSLWPVAAQPLLTNVTPVNVTPGSFSIIGAVSGHIADPTNVTISVFADSSGTTSLAGQIGIELFPLNSGAPTQLTSYGTLSSKRALRQDSMALGMVSARVNYCTPNTTYYYRVSVSNTNGQTAVWPSSGPLPSVTTARENDFVLQSQQLLVTLNDATPTGAIITLSNTNSSSVLAAVVGDGAGTNQAFFNISDLIASAGGTNYLPTGTQLFTAALLGLNSSAISQTANLGFSNEFTVAGPGKLVIGFLLTTVSVGSVPILAGTGSSLPISVGSAAGLVNLSFTLILPTNLVTALSVQAVSPALKSATLVPLSSNLMQLSFAAFPGQNLLGNQQIAQLNFSTPSNDPSAFVPVVPQSIQGTNANPALQNAFVSGPGRIVIVGPQPLLETQLQGTTRNLVLYGIPYDSYQIQYLTTFGSPSKWSDLVRVPMTNLVAVIPQSGSVDPIFYRAYEFTAAPPLIDPGFTASGNQSLTLYGTPGQTYAVEFTTALGTSWASLGSVPLTNSFAHFTNLNGTNSTIFYRLKKQ
jgi:hypothetical protein